MIPPVKVVKTYFIYLKQIDESPGHDNSVVEIDYDVYGKHAITQSFEARGYFPVNDCTTCAAVLPKDHLHEVEGETHTKQGDQIRDQKGPSAIFKTDIREPGENTQ